MDIARTSSNRLASTSKPQSCLGAIRQIPVRARQQKPGGQKVVSGEKSLHQLSSRKPRARAVVAQAKVADPIPNKPIRSIYDVDNGLVLGFGADLAHDHPGFHDEEYKRRRTMIARAATQHTIGEPIPHVDYTPEEEAVWARVLHELRGAACGGMLAAHACKEYLRALHLFNFREDHVPQLQEVSDVLSAATGWRIRPVAGLMHPRHFLAGLAFKYFHSTQYIRHHSRPDYTPEPDLCHELIGHVPILGDPACSALIQAIGQASLSATSEAEIWHLTKIYWYTVEFGVVREAGEVKAFGAGILSSYGELAHMAAGGAALEPFDPFAAQPKMSYKDGYQKRYFLMDTFEDGERKLRAYAAHLQAQAHGSAPPPALAQSTVPASASASASNNIVAAPAPAAQAATAPARADGMGKEEGVAAM